MSVNQPWRPKPSLTRERIVGIAMREKARKEIWTETAALCPECKKPTIRRIGGEWCRWCRGFIEELTIYTAREEGGSYAIRVLRNYNFRR